MLFAGFVVEQNALLQRFVNDFLGERIRLGLLCKRGSHFERVVGTASVAGGIGGDFTQGVVGRFGVKVAESTLIIGKRASEQEDQLFFSQLIQYINTAA